MEGPPTPSSAMVSAIRPPRVGERDPARARAGVPQHVGRALAHDPGQHLVRGRRRRRPTSSTVVAIPAASSARRAPSSSSARVGARIASTAWRTSTSACRPICSMSAACSAAASGSLRRQPAYGLGLDHHHRERVAEQVVQVAGEALPLLGDRDPRQLRPGTPQLGHRVEQRGERRVRHAGQQHHEALGPHPARLVRRRPPTPPTSTRPRRPGSRAPASARAAPPPTRWPAAPTWAATGCCRGSLRRRSRPPTSTARRRPAGRATEVRR